MAGRLHRGGSQTGRDLHSTGTRQRALDVPEEPEGRQEYERANQRSVVVVHPGAGGVVRDGQTVGRQLDEEPPSRGS